MPTKIRPFYQRILLKLSGEVLQGNLKFGIDLKSLLRIVQEIKELIQFGIEVGIVIGGGNIFRGSQLLELGASKVISDYIGMLSTVINGLAIQDIMNNIQMNVCLMSSIPIGGICENYNWKRAVNLLSKRVVVIFSAGTGNTQFTTDSAACLRGIEINADIVLKGTNVDGVYSSDPKVNNSAVMYKKLSYQDVLKHELQIMDLVSFILARDHCIPIRVFNISKPGILYRIAVMGKSEGTLIEP